MINRNANMKESIIEIMDIVIEYQIMLMLLITIGDVNQVMRNQVTTVEKKLFFHRIIKLMKF